MIVFGIILKTYFDKAVMFAGPPVHGALRLPQGCHEVNDNVMATVTTVESLTVPPSRRKWEIAYLFARYGRISGEFGDAAMYLVYTPKVDSRFYRERGWIVDYREHFRYAALPNNVRELCDKCFYRCTALHRVIFGCSSSLERIGVSCFAYSSIREVSVPDAVRELCDQCFYRCKRLHRVTFGCSSSLERIGAEWMRHTRVEEVSIPDKVCELCDKCFYRSRSLHRVTFGSLSSLERVGVSCFAYTPIREVSIPDTVRELCDQCFYSCSSLCRVTFGSSSSLERIGVLCFAYSSIREVSIPNNVNCVIGAFGSARVSVV